MPRRRAQSMPTPRYETHCACSQKGFRQSIMTARTHTPLFSPKMATQMRPLVSFSQEAVTVVRTFLTAANL